MKRICLIIYVIAALLSLQSTAQSCIDTNATAATKKLYGNLYRLQQSHIIFGHQDALAYGVGWKYENGRSDIYSVLKDRPGLYGWDIGMIEMDATKNLDAVPFDQMKKFIREGYCRGALITISWHMRNPLTGGNAWDTTPGSLASVLPGGAKHALFKSWLDKVAVFMNDLKDDKGQMIPVLFRPFHELTGNWFWWCKNNGTPEEFKTLWKFTVHYLRDEKQLHHLLYVYNAASFDNEAAFLERYVGDEYADVLSFDQYQFGARPERASFIKKMRAQLDILTQLAARKNKIAALAETGLEAIPDSSWWTETLWPVLKGYPLAYVLVWRNAGYMPSEKKMHYYAPYPGQASANNFKKFYRNPALLFEKKTKKRRLYQ
ncbi:MAG: glycosyl hydrolase [Ferruginibacter sp.]